METLYKMLGFTAVREKLATYAKTEKIADEARSCPVFLPEKDSRLSQIRSLEMRNCLAVDHMPPLIGFPRQDESLKRIGVVNSILETQELYHIYRILKHARITASFFHEREENYPNLYGLCQLYDSNLKKTEKRLEKLFTADGKIADNASGNLSRLRKKILKLESGIRIKVSEIAVKWFSGQIASDNNVSYRNGRHVIPVRASRKSRAPGIVHDQSQTGQTLFIEPLLIVEMNNDLTQARHEEKQELIRILREKTTELRGNLPLLSNSVCLLEECDKYYSRGQMALDYNCDKPLNEYPNLRIKDGRNLELNFSRKPVPLNLNLPKNKVGIIITGPNAGGKTVTLKTIGLLALMNQAGLLLPANAISSFPQYDAVFADIGDGQSIDGGLSTFSSHILSLKNILENATRDSLVLIDELGTGTDPDEGAALAEGVLQILGERGTTVIATTHHSALKTLAYNNPKFENGSMTFRDQDLEPTYEFMMGIPGSSYAIEIADRYHLSDDVIAIAKERVGKQREKLERLIVDLQRKISRYNERLKEMKERENDLKDQLKNVTDKKKNIDAKYKKAEKDALRRAEDMVATMRREMEAAIRDIRENQAGKSTIKRAQSIIQGTSEQIEKRKENIRDKRSQGRIHIDQIKPGMDVYVTTMKQNGKIIEINQKTGKIWVDLDGSRLRLQPDWLQPAKDIKQKVNTFVEKSPAGSHYRLDLRGKRADEAMDMLDKFIDNAVVSGLKKVEILHGTGSGILQKIVHDCLRKDRRVSQYDFAIPEYGGVGVTLIEL